MPEAKQPPKVSCGSCKFWKRPDLSPREIDNVGTCNAILELDDGVPFWARDMLHRTISWQGKRCLAYIRGDAPKED